MRIFSFIIILSLVWGGYSAAAKAFGLIASCDPAKMASMRMMDCCDHDKGKSVPANCMKCDCCSAALASPALAVNMTIVAALPALAPEASVRDIVAAHRAYPQLRPPNSLI